MESERATFGSKFKYFITVITIVLMTLTILYIPMDLIAVFVHELGHVLAMLIVLPDSNPYMNTVQGWATAEGLEVTLAQNLFTFGAGPLASFIFILVILIFIFPRVKKERVILRLALWLLVFVSFMNSLGYFAQTYFLMHGDTAMMAYDLNWYWGLGLPEGDAPFDTYLFLSIVGIIASIPFLWYTLRKFRDDLLFYCKDMVRYETRKQKVFFTICAIGILPAAGGLVYLLGKELANIDFSTYIRVGLLEQLSEYDISSMISGFLIIASILGLIIMNKYLTKKVREELAVINSKIILFDVIIILFFLIFPYFQIITHYEEYEPWDEYSLEYFPTSQSFFEFESLYNVTTEIWSYGVKISTDPENTTTHEVNLYQSKVGWVDSFYSTSRSGTSTLMLPNLTLWVISMEIPDLRVEPDGNYTLYATSYNFSTVDLYNPPTQLSWENRLPINYTGEVDLYRANTKAYFNPDTGEIWVIYRYGKRIFDSDIGWAITYSPTWFARINPNSSSIIDNQLLNFTYDHELLDKDTKIIFNGNDTLIIFQDYMRVGAIQAYNFFSTNDAMEVILTLRDDEYTRDFIINGNTLLIFSRFNRDIWSTTVDLSSNYEVINLRARITADFPYNYIETSCYYKGKYYIKAYQYNEQFNVVITVYSSMNGVSWTSI